MRLKALPLAACIALLPPAAGCDGGGRTALTPPEDRPPRRMLEIEWAVDFEVGGTLEDSTFAYPGGIASTETRIYATDLYAYRLVAFDRTGTRLWSFGERGAGPGEFANPYEVHVDAGGTVSVFDPDNARITRVARTGELLGSTPLTELASMPGGFVPASTDTYLLAMPGADRPFWIIDAEGGVMQRIAHPRADYARLDRLTRQLSLGHDRRSETWAAAFGINDGFSVFRGDTSIVDNAWYAEPVPPTPVSESVVRDDDRTVRTTQLDGPPTIGAISVAVADSSIYVLFGGRTEDRARLIDVFDVRTGEYRHTMRLQRPATAMTVYGDTFAFLTTRPAPMMWQARPVIRASDVDASGGDAP
ncbi:MAG: hypothetical protein ACODAE_03960 [Gemmatimonadota bacterium]